MVRRQRGGFQKRMNEEYNALMRHPKDCGACLVNYFGGDIDFTEQLYRDSIRSGLRINIISEHIEMKIKENERLQGRNPDDISCSWKSYPDGYLSGPRRGVGWEGRFVYIQMSVDLKSFYETVLPGYSSIAILHPPSGIGHFVTMGKEKDGTEILYCPQKGLTYKGLHEIEDYFLDFGNFGIHAFSVLLCETSNGTQYVEGRGSLGRGAHAGPGDMPRTKSEQDYFLREAIERSMKSAAAAEGRRQKEAAAAEAVRKWREAQSTGTDPPVFVSEERGAPEPEVAPPSPLPPAPHRPGRVGLSPAFLRLARERQQAEAMNIHNQHQLGHRRRDPTVLDTAERILNPVTAAQTFRRAIQPGMRMLGNTLQRSLNCVGNRCRRQRSNSSSPSLGGGKRRSARRTARRSARRSARRTARRMARRTSKRNAMEIEMEMEDNEIRKTRRNTRRKTRRNTKRKSRRSK